MEHKRKLLKNKTNDELIKDIIDFGMEIEGEDYNAGRFGAYGFDRKNISNIRAKARARIAELEKRGINVYELSENFTGLDIDDKHGLYGNDSLEYNLQFI